MLRTRMSRAVLLAGGVAIALLTVGCQDTSTGSGNPDIPSITEATSAPPTTQPPATTAPPSSAPQAQPPVDDTAKPPGEKPAPAANPNECKVADLTLSLAGGDAAAGTTYRQLRFTNSGGRTCTIQGFPGVSYVTGDDGHQVGPAAYRVGTKGPAITLRPGQMAYAPLGFVQVRNYDPAVCEPTAVRGLRVYPPHEYDSMYLPAPGTGCAGDPPGNQLTVRTIQR